MLYKHLLKEYKIYKQENHNVEPISKILIIELKILEIMSLLL